MTAISIESSFINSVTQPAERPQTPHRPMPRVLGRLMSSTLIERAAEFHEAAQKISHQQRLVIENAYELAVDDRNVGTSVNDSRVERLLDDFNGDIVAASGYLLDMASAVQAQE